MTSPQFCFVFEIRRGLTVRDAKIHFIVSLKKQRQTNLFLTLENHPHLPILVETSGMAMAEMQTTSIQNINNVWATDFVNLSLKSISCHWQSVLKVATLTRELSKATSMAPPRPPPLSWETDSRTSLALSHWPIREYAAAALYNT